MVYTAIYQDSTGKLTYEPYKGQPSRTSAWLDAAQKGGSTDRCLVALVPGIHPVYFYNDFVKDTSSYEETIKHHDLYEIK